MGWKIVQQSCVHHSKLNTDNATICVNRSAPHLPHSLVITWILQIPESESKITNSSWLTHNETNFAVMIIIATGHHGSHCVIDHGHDISVKVLSWNLNMHILSGFLVLWSCNNHSGACGIWALTPRFLIAVLRRVTTSFPSTPVDLKALVQDNKILCKVEPFGLF